MKKMTTSLVLTLTLLLSSFSMASNTLSDYPSVRDLINNDNLIIYSYWGCLDEGYTLNDSVVQPIYYLVQPTGDHTFGTVTLTLSKNIGGPNSLTIAYITYEIEIRDDSNGTQYIGSMKVDRTTVY